MRIREYIIVLTLAIGLVSCKEEFGFTGKAGADFQGPSDGQANVDPEGGEGGNISDDLPGSGEDDGEIEGFVTENFTQDQFTEQYDFLWVIDNSGSMSNIRNFMSQNLTDFVTTLESRRSLDWQMAVTITDNVDYQGDLVSGAGGVRVVNRLSSNPEAEWSSIINNIGGTSHSGWEQGLESGRSAIENYGNEFNRPNIPLVVVYISDEEDYSCESDCNNFSGLPENQTGWTAYDTNRYVSHFQQLEGAVGSQVIVYPMVHLAPLGLPDSCDDDYGYQGSRYMQVQSDMGTGESLSLCESDLAASFNRVAQLTANRGVCFQLAYSAVSLLEMIVKVDGNGVAASASEGYEYDGAERSVCFNGSYVPQNGSQVEITYRAMN